MVSDYNLVIVSFYLPFVLGLENCGINVHLLLHLPFFVRCYGPLWTHSAFPFEGQVGHFLRSSHATHGISKQVQLIMNVDLPQKN